MPPKMGATAAQPVKPSIGGTPGCAARAIAAIASPQARPAQVMATRPHLPCQTWRPGQPGWPARRPDPPRSCSQKGRAAVLRFENGAGSSQQGRAGPSCQVRQRQARLKGTLAQDKASPAAGPPGARHGRLADVVLLLPLGCRAGVDHTRITGLLAKCAHTGPHLPAAHLGSTWSSHGTHPQARTHTHTRGNQPHEKHNSTVRATSIAPSPAHHTRWSRRPSPPQRPSGRPGWRAR